MLNEIRIQVQSSQPSDQVLTKTYFHLIFNPIICYHLAKTLKSTAKLFHQSVQFFHPLINYYYYIKEKFQFNFTPFL